MTASTIRRSVLGALVLGAVVAAGLLVSPDGTVAVLESLADDPFVFGLVVAGLYLVRPLFAWPTTPLAVVVGYGYGVWLGVPVALAGAVVTAVPVYAAVRWFASGSPADRSGVVGASLGGLGDLVRRYYDRAGPIRGVTASRLVPIPADVATSVAAASGVSLRHLLVGTAIGEIPWTVAAVVVGASAARLTTDGLGEAGAPLAVAGVFAAGLLLAGPAYRAVRDRATGPDDRRRA